MFYLYSSAVIDIIFNLFCFQVEVGTARIYLNFQSLLQLGWSRDQFLSNKRKIEVKSATVNPGTVE